MEEKKCGCGANVVEGKETCATCGTSEAPATEATETPATEESAE